MIMRVVELSFAGTEDEGVGVATASPTRVGGQMTN